VATAWAFGSADFSKLKGVINQLFIGKY
jgi:hypothetical protein